MTLDKAIAHGKSHRKPYRRSKRFDQTCRNHGSCSYCRNNRLHSARVMEEKAAIEIKGLMRLCREHVEGER